MFNYITCQVIRIVDADTVVIDRYLTAKLVEKDIHVRLLGVWAPEKNTDEGKRLSAWLAQLVHGQYFLLETNSDKRDSFGRLLGILHPIPVVADKFILDSALSINTQINKQLGIATLKKWHSWEDPSIYDQ